MQKETSDLVIFDDCTFANIGRNHDDTRTHKYKHNVKGFVSTNSRMTSPKINDSFRQDETHSDGSGENFENEFA